jgi:hypothetical protein
MKINKHIACYTVLIVISATMLPLYWLIFGDWDYIENHEQAEMMNPTFKQVVITKKPQSIPAPPKAIQIVVSTKKPKSIPATQKPIQTIPKKPCWRRCDQRINKIVYADIPRVGAGINDRGYILGSMAKLAGYLCATVEFPKPHLMLGAMHNHNKPISVNSTWNDYFNFTFYQDSSPAVHDLADDYDMHTEGKYKDWLRVVTGGGKNRIGRDFETVEAFSRLQVPNSATGFVWIIKQPFYPFIPGLRALIASRSKNNYTYFEELPFIQDRRPRQGDCDYSADHLPDHMQTIFDRVVAEIRNANEPHAKIGYLHVRRGDAIDHCNTTLPRMKEYLDCTFNGTQAKARNITLLWSSDEQDPAYRQAIRTIVEQDFDHIKLIDLDALVLRKMEDSVDAGAPKWRLNNFYLFKIVAHVPKIAVFHLAQRRTVSCPHCTYLSTWNIWDS